ncbi:MAG: Gfo/Idh/MocA family oxidoreductase [Clostridia bacterium]|nr:Gfo/Idh/MocA family oxidoreductase [Clostridia bacterium]
MINVAMIGVGAISGIYLENISKTFREIRLVGLCDKIPERAEAGLSKLQAMIDEGVGIELPKNYRDMYEAFADPEVDVVLNLTRPYEHYEVTRAALLAGKHVYSEKPLAVDMDEARELVRIAREKGLRLGGAPDTFMGAGIQTCRKLIDDGAIGKVVGGTLSMICRGHETWHPDPEFYYKRGGGPMLDMGPYYVTALVHLLGEAEGVSALTSRTFPERTITSAPHYGEKITVDVDTHLSGNILFRNGAIVSLFTTFDVYYTNQARFELYGTEGTLVVPDPNTFGGPVLLYRPEDAAPAPAADPGLRKIVIDPYPGYRELPLMFDYRENSRALGLADMTKAIEEGREHRADYRQQLHVLDILTAFEKSSRERAFHALSTSYERSAAMKHNPMHGVLD